MVVDAAAHAWEHSAANTRAVSGIHPPLQRYRWEGESGKAAVLELLDHQLPAQTAGLDQPRHLLWNIASAGRLENFPATLVALTCGYLTPGRARTACGP